jgi:hypothetical protein
MVEPTDEEKARFLEENAKVTREILRGKVNPSEVCRVLRAVAANDEIRIIGSNGSRMDKNCRQIRSNYKSMNEVAADYDYSIWQPSDPIVIQPVDQWVRIVPITGKRHKQAMGAYPEMATPMELFTFGFLYKDLLKKAGTISTFWYDTVGNIWRANVQHDPSQNTRTASMFRVDATSKIKKGNLLVRD